MDSTYIRYTDSSLKDLGVLPFYEIEFDIGISDGANTWCAVVPQKYIDRVPKGGYVYIPGTEYGGCVETKSVATIQNRYTVGGYTWRGLLQRRVNTVRNAQGFDIGNLLRLCINDTAIFEQKQYTYGAVNSWPGERWLTREEFVRKMLAANGYLLQLYYADPGHVVRYAAVPLTDYSKDADFFRDMSVEYNIDLDSGVCNHLICIGSGEGDDRLRLDLYCDEHGTISTTQTFTGDKERFEFFDYTAADAEDLEVYGRRRFNELLQKKARYSISLNTTNEDLEIGDIVGGTEPITGTFLKAPIVRKIYKIKRGVPSLEYGLSSEAKIE